MGTKGKERILNVLIFIGVIGLLGVVGFEQYKESRPSKIKFGVDKTYNSVPFYVAHEDTSRRYFEIEKVIPEFVEITGDPLQGIKDGLYDVAAVPWYSLMLSPALESDTVKAWSSIELKSGKSLDAIVIPTESKIRRLTDLKKMRLGFLASQEYLVDLLIQKMENDNITDIQKVPLQAGEIVTAFETDAADALFLIDPYRSYIIQRNGTELFEGVISFYLTPSLPYMAIVMRKSFVKEENRLAAIRVRDAVEATLNYLARNPDIAKKTVIELNNWSVESEVVFKMKTPEFQRMAEVNLKNVEIFQTELVRMGIGTCGIRPSEFLFEKTDFLR